MKVILMQKVAGLGEIDAVKEVADGYAQNFLFPRHLAVQASAKALADLEAHKYKIAKEDNRDLQEQQNLATKLDGIHLDFKEKANESGLLYSAVTAAKVSESLLKLGHKVDKKQISVPQIKKVGDYKGKIKFRHGLEAEIGLTVYAN